MIIDAFTRYVELEETQSTDAEHAVIALNKIFGRIGTPMQLVSDRGTQFVNNLLAEYCTLAGIQLSHITAHSKEENAIVERANKEVMRHLRAWVYDKRIKTMWSRFLPFVMRIINTKRHNTTKVAPVELMYGTLTPLIERSIFDDWTPSQVERLNLSDWMKKMLKAQQILLKIAVDNQLAHDTAHLTKKSKEDPTTEYPVGTFVLVAYPSEGMHKGPPSKIMTNLRGPLRVLAYNGTSYDLLNLTTNKIEYGIHVKRLKPFDYDPDHTNPVEVSNTDSDSFIVEEIVQHQGNPNRKTEMVFEVKWKYFPSSENTWEPWSSVRDTDKLHEYLSKNGLAKLLPKPSKRGGKGSVT